MLKAYLLLTKPRISLLFAITGLAALMVEGSLRGNPVKTFIITLAVFFVGGAANGLNQYFERDVDSRMVRTSKKRPLPQGLIRPGPALIFSLVMGVVGNVLLLKFGGILATLLGLGTILFYSFFYTLWLKPRTPYNIVIGGASGATAPLIAWAAVTQTLSLAPLLMALIIFLWTPPHFWALALCCKEDYARVGYPMLPIVSGDEFTRRQILSYTLFLFPLSLGPYFIQASGRTYFYGAVVLGLLFILGAFQIIRKKTIKSYWQFFGFSIVYLTALFTLMIVDQLV